MSSHLSRLRASRQKGPAWGWHCAPGGPIDPREKGRSTLVAWCRSAAPGPGGSSDPLRWQSGRPLTPPPGWRGVSGDVTGGDYSLVRAVVRPPLTGRAEGGAPPPGRPPRAAPSAPQPAPGAHASPRPRVPSSKVRFNFDALSLPPLCRSSVAAAKQAEADIQAQPRGPTRRSAAIATVAKERASGRQRGRGERLARSAPLGTARGFGSRRAPDLCRLNESSRCN